MQVWSFRKLNGGTPKSSKLDHFSIETIMVTWGSTILSNTAYNIFWIMQNNTIQLVGGLDHFLFFHILGRIIPTDELIFFLEG